MSQCFDENFVLTLVSTGFGIFLGLLLSQTVEVIKKRTKRKRILAALLRQIAALPRFSLHNKTATEQSDPEHIVPMFYPIAPFETAIFSENGVSVKEDTLQSSIDYLIKAYELNALVQVLQDTFTTPKDNNSINSRSQAKTKLLEHVSDDSHDYSMFKCIENLRLQFEKEQSCSTHFQRYIKSRKEQKNQKY